MTLKHYCFAKKYVYILFLLCLTRNTFGQNQEYSEVEKQQLIEWSQKCIQEYFKAMSTSDTILYEPKEWILIVQNALYPIYLKMNQKSDMLRGCIKILDNREDFDQYQEISEDPDAFIAISLVYDITSKHTGAKIKQSETTFILDDEGRILELHDYTSPTTIRKFMTMRALNTMKAQTHEVLGQDTTNSKWLFQTDIQNWILQKDGKTLIQFTPLELIFFNQKYMEKLKDKSLTRIKRYD